MVKDTAGNNLHEDDGQADGWIVIDRSTGVLSQDFFRILADASGDGFVDSADLDIWQQNYDPAGINNNTPGMGDFDLDGRIGGTDLAIWQQSYSPTGLAPIASLVKINNGAVQRSNTTELTVQFNKSMNLDTLITEGTIDDYVKLYDLANPNVPIPWLDQSRFNWNSNINTLLVDFTVDGFGGSNLTNLVNGRYELRLDTTGITDLSGNNLVDDDGVIDGLLRIDRGTVSSEQDFFRLECDANGDARVNGIDLSIWQQNYDPTPVNNNTPGMGDWNLDERVDVNDLIIWQQQFDPTKEL